MDSPALNPEPENEVLIRFQDCDPFGHLNNARYLDYFLNAREDHLRAAYDFSVSEWSRTHQAAWVVTRHEVAYVHAANLSETVLIRSALLGFTKGALQVEFSLHDLPKRRLKALMWTDMRYVDTGKGTPAEHPQELLDLFGRVALADVAAQGFAARLDALKRRPLKRASEEPASR